MFWAAWRIQGAFTKRANGMRRDEPDARVTVRLTRKFIAALVIGVALVAMIQGFLDYRRERDVFDRQMRGEATALGRALARGVADVWQRDGEAAARQFLLTASSKSEHIRSALGLARRQATRDAPRRRARARAAQRRTRS